MSKRLAVMVSGGGSNLQAILDGIDKGEIDAKVVVVISSKPGVYALERAKQAGVDGIVIAKKDYETQEAFFAANLKALQDYQVEVIVLAGYLSILSPEVVRAYPNRILNIHPALIPSFCGKGYYGIRVHQAVLDYGAKVSGATVHFVDEGADTGPIILQEAVPVLAGDTAEDLAARVLEVEHKLLPRAVALFAKDALQVDGRHVRIIE